MSAALILRDGFPDPRHRSAIRQLLLDTFGIDIALLDKWHLADPTYRAFSYLLPTGCCVANAAAFTLPLLVNNKRVTATGIQSVATRPAWRGRGLSRDLLRRALRWCDAHAQTTCLMTAIPDFYEPLGFRIVPQFRHVGHRPAVSGHVPDIRRLDLHSDDDCRLLRQVLLQSSPVSERFSIADSAGAFMLNLFDQDELVPWYMPAGNAVVVTQARSDDRLRIVDIAASDMPPFRDVVTALDGRSKQVEVHFPPDRLDWNATPVPAEVTTVLMARGAWQPIEPFMVPATMAF